MSDEVFKIVAVGERGQVVIPADVRRMYDIRPGDKILVLGQAGRKHISLVKFAGLADFLSVCFGSDIEERDISATGLQQED